jgi:peptidoglycan/LPS O-acetylase OafA/YrhL
MDLSAAVFGLMLFILSAAITYHWGIKPEREARKRRANEIREAARRQQELSRQRFLRREKPITHTQSGAHS